MRILVTGGSGFVGSHVVERLQSEGVELRLMLRRSSNTQFLSDIKAYERVEGSLGDVPSLHRAVEGVDTVIHIAGATIARTSEEYEAANGVGTANLVDASVKAGVRRFVYLSSLAALGPSPDGKPQPADALPHPVTAYGASKLMGERALQAQADRIEYVMLRPPAIYGPRDNGFLMMFKGAMLGVFPLLGDGQNLASFTYVTDTADAIVRVALSSTPQGAIYSIEDGQPNSWRHLVDVFEAASGRRVRVILTPPAVYKAVGIAGSVASTLLRKTLPISSERVTHIGQRYWVCDSEALKHDLGWRPKVGIDEGLKLTYDWYRAHHWL